MAQFIHAKNFFTECIIFVKRRKIFVNTVNQIVIYGNRHFVPEERHLKA